MTGSDGTVPMTSLKELARAERSELAAFLATLTPEQWDSPTLCADWNVRQVVAHMFSYEDLSTAGLVARMFKAGFRNSRSNAISLAEFADKSPEQLLRRVNDHLEPHGLPAAFGGMIAFLDGLIHHQDIRRGLGAQRDVPAERLERALPLSLKAPVLPAKRNARGLRVRATDVDVAFGDGPVVEGPAEALLMALAGRHGVVDELSGEGQAVLA
ncbi:MAG: maleylpyruvate isomerase family mycothiol-dependent enzyme, partial [Stackebrandtia sp.]